jgi:hypothetical protein
MLLIVRGDAAPVGTARLIEKPLTVVPTGIEPTGIELGATAAVVSLTKPTLVTPPIGDGDVVLNLVHATSFGLTEAAAAVE